MADVDTLDLTEILSSGIANSAKVNHHLDLECGASPPTPDTAPKRINLYELNKSMFASDLAITLTRGTLTDSAPAISTSQTWNDAADTFIGNDNAVTDTASAAGSLCERWRVGGTSQFSIGKAGKIEAAAGGSFGFAGRSLIKSSADASLTLHAADGSALSALTALGLTLTGGTVTASTPLLDITQTWNASGVTFRAAVFNITDTASNVASLLLDLQVGGVSKFSVRKDGSLIYPASGTYTCLTNGTSRVEITSGAGNCISVVGGTQSILQMTNGTNKVFLICEAAETLSLRNALTGTIAQNFLIYNTYTSASVYERGFMRWASNQLEIGTEHTGGSDRNIVIKRGSITHLTFGSNQITFSNSINFVFGTGSGNKLGTSASQLIGFWNATPIVQPAHADQAAFTDSTGGTAAASLVDVTASHDQAKLNDNFATLAKLVLAMRTALVNSGLMKGAA